MGPPIQGARSTVKELSHEGEELRISPREEWQCSRTVGAGALPGQGAGSVPHETLKIATAKVAQKLENVNITIAHRQTNSAPRIAP